MQGENVSFDALVYIKYALNEVVASITKYFTRCVPHLVGVKWVFTREMIKNESIRSSINCFRTNKIEL